MKTASLTMAAAACAACASEPPCLSEVGVLCTVAGVGTSSDRGEGPAGGVDIGVPIDVAVGPDDSVYIVDLAEPCVRRIDPASKQVTRVVGSGHLERGCPAGQSECDARDYTFGHAASIAFDTDGDMLIADFTDSVIVPVKDGRVRTDSILGSGARGYGGEGGDAQGATFYQPSSVVAHPEGGWLVTDQANQVIRRIQSDGTIDRFAGDCVVWDESTNGVCEAPASCPDSDKATCSTDNTCQSRCAQAFAGDGGSALAARLALPSGGGAGPAGRLAVQIHGTVYVADTVNNRIRRIDRGGIITTVAGNGSGGFNGDGRSATSAQLNLPADVAVAADGTLYVADTYNHCVRSVDRRGFITAVAGTCGHSGQALDGEQATSTHLDHPFAVEVHGDILYIADSLNRQLHAVRLE